LIQINDAAAQRSIQYRPQTLKEAKMTTQQIGVTARHAQSGPFSITVVGFSLSVFFVISYVICLIGYLVLPGLPIPHTSLTIFLPGFKLLDWPSFFIGLAESFAWGWYVAVILMPLYNFFARRFAA
jgi:hypothetical protein